MAHTIALQVVGVVRAPYAEEDEERDWTDVESEIQVYDEFLPGLQGMPEYTDLVVTFLLHKLRFDPERELVQQVVRGKDAEPRGVFTLRTYHRPNAIGATTVRLLTLENGVLHVKGLDALDGSPVLDIKPYAPPVLKRSIPLPDVEPEI